MVNFLVQMKLNKFQNNLEITLKIMKKYLEISSVRKSGNPETILSQICFA